MVEIGSGQSLNFTIPHEGKIYRMKEIIEN